MSDISMTVDLTEAERDIIVAALRHWQERAPVDREELIDIATSSYTNPALTPEEIDTLIEEKLNR